MDENVAKAVAHVDLCIGRDATESQANWQTIRARLVELEAENERLRELAKRDDGAFDAMRQVAVSWKGRAEKAEALLRECEDVFVHRADPDDDLAYRITAHLSENGHG